MSNVKVEDDEDLALDDMCPWQIGANVASSSSSRVRSSFIEMGFPPSLVDKAIEENGEDNEGMLLETLCEYSAQKDTRPMSLNSLGGFPNVNYELAGVLLPNEKAKVPNTSSPESSDSLDSLFGEKNDASSHVNISVHVHPKEEPDISSGVRDEKKVTLLMMNFSEDEVDYAINKLGEDAPISDIIDFISAAQIAENSEKNVQIAKFGDDEKNADASTETLFGTLNNTLRLLEMGFSEKDISAAIDMCGSEASVEELADSIVSGQIDKYTSNPSWKRHVNTSRSLSGMNGQGCIRYDDLTIKTEDHGGSVSVSEFTNNGMMESCKGKRPKEGYINECTSSKRPKEEYDDDLSSALPPWLEARQGISKKTSSRPAQKQRKLRQAGESTSLPKPVSCKSLDQMAAGPPYFFYGNVLNLSQDSWIKISQFLYAVEPEFVNTQFFSALSRKEGYVHNLPNENRFHLIPRSLMTIEEVIPSTKKWWPPWDTRKQISCINTDLTGISQQCNRLEGILNDYGGLLSVDQQTDLLHRCKIYNLVWVGHNKLKPVEPEHVERILGYPVNHTQAAGFSPQDRLQALKHCFQIDTLGYHLSVLKSMFPEGLTLLSLYSGVGGAELTLHRLGIRLKGVVSVETCEIKRKILKQWWSNSGQVGELVQIEDIQKLSTSKFEIFKQRFGGFDLVICQTPTTNAKCPTIEDYGSISSLDFSLFYEFVRIWQRVRSMTGNRR